MEKENLLSVKEYAALCGITTTSVWKRIKKGEIKIKKQKCVGIKNPITFIDTFAFPPSGKKRSGAPIGRRFIIVK